MKEKQEYKTVDFRNERINKDGVYMAILFEIATAKAQGYRVIKFLHAPEGDEQGRTTRTVIRREIRRFCRMGKLNAVLNGEDFATEDLMTTHVFSIFPYVMSDPALDKKDTSFVFATIARTSNPIKRR